MTASRLSLIKSCFQLKAADQRSALKGMPCPTPDIIEDKPFQ
jgi:hypothetical protein